MAQPPSYNRQYNFVLDEEGSVNSPALNAEFDNASTSINKIRDNLAKIQSDDGSLKAGIVDRDALSADVVKEVVDEVEQAAENAAIYLKQAEAAANSAINAKNEVDRQFAAILEADRRTEQNSAAAVDAWRNVRETKDVIEQLEASTVNASGSALASQALALESADVAVSAKNEAVNASEAAIAAANSAGFAVRYLSYASAGADFALSSITPDVNVRVGDHVMNSDGDIFRVVAIANGYATLGETLTSFRGPEGIQGPRGPQGESIVGPQGPQGIPGAQGVPGEGLRILDTYNTYGLLIANHPTGKPGDAYFVGSDLYIWSATLGLWVNKGQIGSGGGIAGLMNPDPREYFLYVLNGGVVEDEDGGGGETAPILDLGKLDYMVLA